MHSVLIVGNCPGVIGGQNRVVFFLSKALQKLGWTIFSCGQGDSVLPEGENLNIKTYPFNPLDKSTVEKALDESKCEIALFSHDIWIFYFLPELKIKYPHVKFVLFGTVDAHPIHASWIPILRAADQVVLSTNFGKKTIYESVPERHLEVIEYGIDHNHFKFPTAPKAALKKRFGDANNLIDLDKKCIYVYSGANQGKKGIGCIIDAFRMMNNPDTHLILVLKSMQCKISAYEYIGEFDLHGLIAGCSNISIVGVHLDDSSLANLYQLSDFLPYPSQGEAPGLPLSEAQLCSCIPLATNYTGMADEVIWKDFSLTKFILTRGQFNCYRAIVSAEELCEKMTMGFNFWKLLNSGDQKAQEIFVDVMKRVYEKFKDRTWENVALKFDSIFKDLMRGDTRIESEVVSL